MNNENTSAQSTKIDAKRFRYGILSFVGCLSITMTVGLHSSIAVAEGEETVTGDASWTYQDAAGGTFYVSMIIGENSGTVRSWGADPPASDFPLELRNGDGESVTVSLTAAGEYSFDASIAASSVTAGGCSNTMCNPVTGACVLIPGSNTRCDTNGKWCWNWQCGGGGGGIKFIDVLTAAP